MKKHTFWQFLTPAILATFFSLYLFLGDLPDDGTSLLAIPHKDKLVHAVIFGGLSALYFIGFKKQKAISISDKQIQYIILLSGFLYACFTEWAQMTFTTYRSADPWDILADMIGVGLSLFFCKKIVIRYI